MFPAVQRALGALKKSLLREDTGERYGYHDEHGHGNPEQTAEWNGVALETVAWKEPPRWLPTTFQSLVYRNYLFLVVGQVCHSLSLWMDMVARPVLVIALTGSAVQLGLVSMVRGVPMMLLAPVAGVIADRFDRRLVVLLAKGTNMVVHIVFAFIVISGNLDLWLIYVTAIIKSIVNAFEQPARQALLPSTVPLPLLTNAVALHQGSMQLTRIISATVAGFLIAGWALVFGFGENDTRAFGGVYLAMALTLVVGLVATYMLRFPAGARMEGHHHGSFFTSFMTALRFAWHHAIILGVLILLVVNFLFGQSYRMIFLPWLAIQDMQLGPQGVGLLLAINGAGALVGSVAIAAWGHRLRHRGWLIISGLVFKGLLLVGLGFTSLLPMVTIFGLTMPLLPILIIVVAGTVDMATMAMKNILLFESIPDEFRGRIMSLQSLDRGFSTIGNGVAGFAIALLGGPYSLALFGGLLTLGSLVVGSSLPNFRKVD
ncbi:MAG: MFS transporter [Dehalococcoidales bacterium]|nr:MFS transporter [Dehalococcoidales bacterium]